MKSLGIKAYTVDGKKLVLHSNGEKISVGKKGFTFGVRTFLGTLTKGEARKVRKALRARGFVDAASFPRIDIRIGTMKLAA